jgi:hypothetical protein
VLSSNSKDREKFKFIYSGYAILYRKKKLKNYKNTWDDYSDGEIVNQWLENKHKGLIKYRGDKVWSLSSLELCDNNLIAYCLDGVMVYQEV